jgi:uncharacterized protein
MPWRQPSPDDDFDLRELMIPMRDGVELHTWVLSPKETRSDLPILLMRTPYDAAKRMGTAHRTVLHAVLGGSFAELPGYIFAFQDIRGRHGSGGVFEINRPPRGEFNRTATDETTDAWDTIEWLVKNVPANNGRVAIHGTSYEGWTALMALLDPHPALKVAIPTSPLVDGWIGDDWFHNGAFRLPYAFEYVYSMGSDAKSAALFPYSHYDTYTWWLKAGSPVEVGRRYLDEERHRFWKVLTDNPAYSPYWRAMAVDRLLRESTAKLIPTLHVHGWFDQEDIYGAPAAYAAMKARDHSNDLVYFVAGPWRHGQSWTHGSSLGAVGWSEDTAQRWREDQLAPFLEHYLKDGPAHRVPPVSVFNTGSRRWESLDAWPAPTGTQPRSLYLAPGSMLSWHVPEAPQGTAEAYMSDPAKPVPYQPRPVRRTLRDDLEPAAWQTWLAADQRFVDGRPDVLTFVSPPLEEKLTVRGAITARLFAETTGTDADWIVKVIDAFPDLDGAEPRMSGYQLMIAGEILRGRYRRSFEQPEAITPDRALEYLIRLPQVNHTFRPGHRLVVQIQSTWFPLYDRNPQRFVPAIMDATAEDYQPATHRIHTNAVHASRIELHVQVAPHSAGRNTITSPSDS